MMVQCFILVFVFLLIGNVLVEAQYAISKKALEAMMPSGLTCRATLRLEKKHLMLDRNLISNVNGKTVCTIPKDQLIGNYELREDILSTTLTSEATYSQNDNPADDKKLILTFDSDSLALNGKATVHFQVIPEDWELIAKNGLLVTQMITNWNRSLGIAKASDFGNEPTRLLEVVHGLQTDTIQGFRVQRSVFHDDQNFGKFEKWSINSLSFDTPLPELYYGTNMIGILPYPDTFFYLKIVERRGTDENDLHQKKWIEQCYNNSTKLKISITRERPNDSDDIEHEDGIIVKVNGEYYVELWMKNLKETYSYKCFKHEGIQACETYELKQYGTRWLFIKVYQI